MAGKKQTEIVLDHIDLHGYITNREASRRYEIYRLSEVIRILRDRLEDGTTILTVDQVSDTTGKHYARYYRIHRDRLPERVKKAQAPRIGLEEFVKEKLLVHGELYLRDPIGG